MMQFVKGNLLADLGRHPALLHGVNVQGALGAGFAAQLRRSLPDCVQVYTAACESRTLRPGGIVVYVPNKPGVPYVIHAATQEFYGRRGRARVEWLRSALQNARTYLDDHNRVEVAMPRIASGLGGLDWDSVVLPVVDDIFDGWAGTAVIYSLD